ncbi:MAG: hypothetical protein IJ398_05125 [Clostridia bacterium]|nr:hypothetical protein [Clostridia bacterium]
MLYKEYENRIGKVIGFLKKLWDFRILIISVLSGILLLTTAFLATKGILYGESGLPEKIEYGQEYDFSASALFSDVRYEYSKKGTNEWSEKKPTQVGEYLVRAVSNGSFGEKEGEEFSFLIVPKKITVTIKDEAVRYGDMPSVQAALAYSDTVECDSFTYKDITQQKTTASPIKEKIRILSKDGKDVTASYEISTQGKEITFTKRPISLLVENAEMEYDGTRLTSQAYEISGGTLAKGDKLIATFELYQIEVGACQNTPTLRIVNAKGKEVTSHYDISKTIGSLTVKKRTIIVYTGAQAFMYDGNEHKSEYFKLDEKTPLLEGDTIEYVSSPAITNAGQSYNSIEFSIKNKDGVCVNDNYNIIYTEDSLLTVNKRPIIITTDSGVFDYDGYLHSQESHSVTGGEGLALGHNTAVIKSTKVKNHVINEENILLIGVFAGSEDVTSNYEISYENGSLTVNKRPLIVVSGSSTKTYDATPLICHEHTYKNSSLADNHTVIAKYTGAVTEYGQSVENTMLIVVWDENEMDVSENYEISYENGSLTIKQREITVLTSSISRPYDATPLIFEDVSVTSQDKIVEGQEIKYIKNSSITRVGNTANILEIEIWAGEEQKTQNYKISYEYGTLEVTKREITIKANDDTKTYDDTPLTNNGYTITVGSLAQGDTASVLINGSRTEAGIGLNLVDSYEINNSELGGVTDCYNVTTQAGELLVNQRVVVVYSRSDEKIYDATPLYLHEIEISDTEGDGLVEGHKASVTFTGEVTNAISVENTFEMTILKGTEDVTKNYSVDKRYGTLTVHKRPVLFTSGNGEKIYDALPLYNDTCQHVVGIIEGTEYYALVGGHTYKKSFGEHTYIDAKEYQNLFTVKISDSSGDVTDNYEITYSYGILKVNKRPITVVSGGNSKIYDGVALTEYSYTIDLSNGGYDIVFGEKLVITYTGQRTNYGESENTFEADIIGRDLVTSVKDNYIINKVYGTLKVNKRPIIITSATDTKVYDGTPLVNTTLFPEAIGVDRGILDKHRIEGLATGSQTIVGTSQNTIGDIKIIYEERSHDGESENISVWDVTESYEITLVLGTLTVTPRHVIVTAGSSEKPYDGTPLTNEGYDENIGGDGLAKGQYITVTTSGSQTEIGSSKNIIVEIQFFDADGNDVGANYTYELKKGTLTVIKRHITVAAGSDEKVYDGKELTCDTYEVGSLGLLDGHTLSAVISGSITNKGESANKVISVQIVDGEGNSVYDYYDPELIDGLLKITPRPIYAFSGSASKHYDKTPLYKHECWVSEDKNACLVEGHKIEGANFASLTVVGLIDNKFDLIIKDANDIDVTENYEIYYEFGTLEVTAVILKLETLGGTKPYDGTPLTNAGYILDDTNKVNTHIIKVTTKGSQTIVGKSTNTYEITIVDQNGADVSSNYYIEEKLGTLEVTKCQITIETSGATKMYDGTPLTNPEWKSDSWYSSLAYLNGHELTVAVTGTITRVGKAPNTFEATIKNALGEDVTPYFEIEKIEGELEITLAPLVFKSYSDSKPYDGVPLVYEMALLEKGCLIEGHEAEYTFTGSILNFGESENTFSVKIVDENGEDVSEIYDISCEYGTLKITARKITITASSAIKEYDGKPLLAPLEIKEPNEDLIELNSQFETPRFTWEVKEAFGSQTEIGKSPSSIKDGGFIVYLDGKSVPMENFEIEYLEGTLTVAETVLRVYIFQIKKFYNGLPLAYEAGDWVHIGGEIPSDCELIIELEGVSLTEAGILDLEELRNQLLSEGKIRVMRGSENVTSSYEIVFEGVGLEVEQRQIEITPDFVQKIYDGKALEPEEYTITKGSLVPGHRIEKISIDGSRTKVGTSTSTVVVESVKIVDGDGNDVTSNYLITSGQGTIEILPEE